ncbi:guanine deaminase [Moesziomyces antarcticus]|uniref:Related to guanine deaminase n=2 Tax=Pseudozyma antarctica TaxID=84753 RepID=A0A5C3FNP9_PSEA2|nr:guanine deaminase [Moesziomyces antarcticus]GAK65808.1 guanine deaminase [Moesziomyces antarcticus]SPO45435.1 related to guanine deaminase [Moesziomyces antarcticus]
MTIARPNLRPPFGGNGYPTSASENFRPAMPAPHLLPKRVFVGAIISSRSATDLSIIQRGLLGVGSGGVIRFLEDLDVLERQVPHAAATASAASPSAESSTSASTSTTGTAIADAADDRSSTPVPIPGSTRSSLPEAPELTSLEMPPPAVPTRAAASSSFDASQDEAARREQQLIKHVLDKHGWRQGQYKLTRLPPGSFLCSGFIDTHTHACQVPNIGLGQQYELLDWLQHVTFPRERRFEDARYARKTYESVVQRLIDSGTTTACYYATLHLEASKILAEICNERGQRAFVGKCQMDRNSPIDYIEKNASQSIEDTKEFVRFTRSLRPYGQPPDVSSPSMSPADLHSTSPEMDASIARLSATMDELMSPTGSKPPSETNGSPSSAKVSSSLKPISRSSVAVARQPSSSSIRSARESGTSTPSRQRERELNNALVQPILTPRFAISCTDAMLTGISALLSRDPTLRVQTHLSENEGEITFTKQLFPFAKNYTSVYDHYSLLGPRTILAHAVHLDADELAIIKKRKCGVSHCPTSNLNLRSGASRVGEMLNMGIKVGLGTDVSGGFGLGMLSAIREASVVAKVLAFQRAQAESKAREEAEELAATAPPTSEQAALQAQQPLGGAPPVDGRYPGPPVAGQYQPRKPHSIATSNLNPVEAKQSVQDPASSMTSKSTVDFTKGPLSIATLFYLATLGGAEVCAMASRIGSLEAGKEFDALLVQTTSHWGPSGYTGNPGCFVEEDDTLPDVFEKWLFTGDDRNIATVFVRGRVVGGAKPIRD